MSEEQTVAVETTATTTEAPQETQASVDTSTQVETKTEAVTDDYSWVPTKFLVDGKPDFNNLAKSYQTLEKKIGAKVQNLAPEDISEYAFESKLVFDEEATIAWKNEAKELGLSTKQYDAVMGKYEAALESITMTKEKAAVALKESWGEADFNANLMNAKKAFEEYAPSDISIDDPAFNNPVVLKFLARIGSELGEDSAPNRSSQSSGLSEAEIHSMMQNPEYNMAGSKTRQTVDSWFKSFDK